MSIIIEKKGGSSIMNVELTGKEVELLTKSINHCLASCKNGTGKEHCTDCSALEEVLKKLQ